MPKPLIAILGLVLVALAVFVGIKLGGDDMQTAVKPADPDKPVVAQTEKPALTAAEKEAEAKKKAEEAKAAAEEAEKKAAEAKAAADAAAAKKAEEERLAAEAEAEAKRKGEQERLAAEAKAEEERHAAEEEARQKEEEEKAAAAQAEADRAAKLAEQKKQEEAAKIAEPSFDIVRIEDDGNALAAGRAKPGATITLNKNGKAAGTTTANERGEWVIVLEEPLDKGSHQITLQSQNKDEAPIASKQAALVEIPESGDQKPLVVLSDDANASRVLQAPQSAQAEDKEGQDPEGPTETAKASQSQEPEAEPGKKIALSLGAVDYDDAGTLMFSGRVTAGETVRLYVDNAPLADAKSDKTGNWLATAQRQIKPGSHNLRIDQLGKDGKPIGRIELPFFREEPAKVAALLKSRGVNVEPKKPAPTATETEKSESITTETAGNGDGGNTTSETAATDTSQTTTSDNSESAAETSSATTDQSDSTTGTQQVAGQESTGAGQQVAATATSESATTETSQTMTTDSSESASEASGATDDQSNSTPDTQQVAGQESSGGGQKTAGNGDGGATTTDTATLDTQTVDTTQLASNTTAEPAANTSETEGVANETTSEDGEDVAVVTPATGSASPGQVVIQPGNNLWRISRVIYGKGLRYTVIYQANKEQIRDPSLIYPGQIFTTPGVVPPRSIDPTLNEPMTGASDPEDSNINN
ncbi:MAG: LysM peptidoglycan-binding domain-containing protein [Hyphomicrobiales bacterium]